MMNYYITSRSMRHKNSHASDVSNLLDLRSESARAQTRCNAPSFVDARHRMHRCSR